MTKHAVVGKFNEIRPGMYREFMRDVAGAAADAQSHSAHRVVAFEPLAPAALALRIAATLAAVRVPRHPPAPHCTPAPPRTARRHGAMHVAAAAQGNTLRSGPEPKRLVGAPCCKAAFCTVRPVLPSTR